MILDEPPSHRHIRRHRMPGVLARRPGGRLPPGGGGTAGFHLRPPIGGRYRRLVREESQPRLEPFLAAVLAVVGAAILWLVSIAAGAIQNFSYARLIERAEREGRGAEVVPRLNREESFVLAVLTVESLAAVVFVLGLSSWVAATFLLSAGVAFVVATAVAFLLLLFVLRTVPYVWGRDHAESVLIRILPLLDGILVVVRPLVRASEAVGGMLARVTNSTRPRTPSEDLADEIRSAVAEGESEGLLEGEEKAMIERIIELRDADAADAMTPRTDMVSIPITTTIDEAIRVAMENGHSRIPVFSENRDEIRGVLYVKDLLPHWGRTEDADLSLKTLLRPAYFVPAQTPISRLLAEFKSRKIHFAIVVDEYGGTAGIITIEDILEEIVGEIADEYDPELVEQPLTVIDNVTVEADARTHIEDLGDALRVELEDDGDYDTVGGLLFTTLGRVPVSGENVETDGLRFTVLDADERRVRRVRVERIATE